jgi:hypothetical protein
MSVSLSDYADETDLERMVFTLFGKLTASGPRFQT